MNKTEQILQELFKLEESELEPILTIFKRRRAVIHWKNDLLVKRSDWSNEWDAMVRSCEHPATTVKKVWSEDEYGRLTNYGYKQYVCPDCEKSWIEDFNDE